MKCAICKSKTNWDESYGYNEFIVCPRCYDEMKVKIGKTNAKTMDIIFILGNIAYKNQKKENLK